MNVLMDEFGLPAGRYPAKIEGIELLEPKRRIRHWRLKITLTVLRNGKQTYVFKKLAARDAADPYELTPGRSKSLRKLAGQLKLKTDGPVEDVIAAIRTLVNHEVSARVRPSPTGLAVQLFAADDGHDQKVLAGEVLDTLPEVIYTQRTQEAHNAHEQLVTGLRQASHALHLVCQACWQLRQEEGWLALGYDSLREYLASPEISLSRTAFYTNADIWQHYVETGALEPTRLVAPSKLEVPLPALKTGAISAEEAASDAEALGLRDLRRKYRGEPEQQERKHKIELPCVCKACGTVIEDEEAVAPV